MRVGLIPLFLIAMQAAAVPTPTSLPTATPTSSPTTKARPEPSAATPKEALRSLKIAQRDGDVATIRSFFLTDDDDGTRLVGAMADYTASLVALYKAAEKAYGPNGASMITGDIIAQSAEDVAAIDKADVAIQGDKAAVTYAGAKDPPVKLVKVAGRWKLPLVQLLEGVDRTAEQRRIKELRHQANLASEMAKELANGKYREGPNHAAAIWRARLIDPAGPRK